MIRATGREPEKTERRSGGVTVSGGFRIILPSFCAMLLLASAAYFATFISPMYYVDDGLRVYTHTSISQGVNGRPLADWAYACLSGGLFVDISPLSQIYALAALLVTALLLGLAFLGPDILLSRTVLGLASRSCALLFALLPLNFAILAYRFDSIGMCLGAFCAVAACSMPFLWRSPLVIPLAAALLCASLALYQPMAGMYFVGALALLASRAINQEPLGRKALQLAAAAILGGAFYLPIYIHARAMASLPFCGLPRHPIADAYFGAPANLLEAVFRNVGAFLHTVRSYATPNMITFSVLALIAISILAILLSNCTRGKKFLALALILGAFMACGSFLYIIASPSFSPRCMIPLSLFVLCSAFIALRHGGAYLRKITCALGILCIFASANAVTAFGNAERDQYEFEEQMILQPLCQDMTNILASEKDVKSFFLQGHFPENHIIRLVNSRYVPVCEPTGMLFGVARLLSWLPLRYDLDKAINMKNMTDGRLLADRPGYAIYLTGGNVIGILLKKWPVPEAPQRFETDPDDAP